MDFLDGVRAQPDYLAASRATVAEALDGMDTSVLRRGTTVVLGIGASGHAAAGFAARLRERGARAYAVSSGDGTAGTVDCYLALSYSGRSRETVELLGGLGRLGGTRIGVTGHPEAPLASVVDRLVPLGSATDTAVSTLSYTATVQALGMLADHAWGGRSPAWPELPGHAAAMLADATLADRIASAFDKVSCVDVVGSGARAGTAGAAALLLREAAHLPAAGHSLREYLHGPLEVAGPGRGALIFGDDRALTLAQEMAAWGSPTVLITTAEPAGSRTARPATPAVSGDADGGPVVIRRPALAGSAGDVLDILPVQLAAAELAHRAGIPIALRHMPADTKLTAGPGRREHPRDGGGERETADSTASRRRADAAGAGGRRGDGRGRGGDAAAAGGVA